MEKSIVVAIAILLFGIPQVLACESHEQANRESEGALLAAKGPITFQPEAPSRPVEGEIWIDARSGAQWIFHDGEWLKRFSGYGV